MATDYGHNKVAKGNIGFVRKVQKGLLELGKKYTKGLPVDRYRTTKLRHFNRRFIRDYIHSFPFDRELQTFNLPSGQHYDLAPFSYFNYTTSPTVQQLQWLAGFTEHFCSFTVQYTPKYHTDDLVNVHRWHPIVRLFYVGTCFPLLKYIANWYNGKILQYKSGHWGLVLSSDKCLQLLRDIYPYSVLKTLYFYRLIEFIALYKTNTKQFRELNSFENFTEGQTLIEFTGFKGTRGGTLHYLGGFYDAKGNVDYYSGPRLVWYSQCKPLLEGVKLHLETHYNLSHLGILYNARDNVYRLHTENFHTVMQFLEIIQQVCVYKRVYAELWQTWLPVFKNTKGKTFTHVRHAIKMYWLFLQYGIELDNSESIW